MIFLEFNKEEICKGVGWGKDTHKVECRTLGLGDCGATLPLPAQKRQQSKGTTTTEKGKLYGEDLLKGTMVSARGTKPIHSNLVYFQILLSFNFQPQQGTPIGLHDLQPNTRKPLGFGRHEARRGWKVVVWGQTEDMQPRWSLEHTWWHKQDRGKALLLRHFTSLVGAIENIMGDDSMGTEKRRDLNKIGNCSGGVGEGEQGWGALSSKAS